MSARKLIDEWYGRGTNLSVPGANSRIWRMGDGPCVVCLHGVPASGFLYRKVLPELERHGLEGVTFDLPGLGFAERPRNFDYSWSGLAGWVVNTLEAARIERLHLVVHDLGGPVGFEVARRLPARILSLTVLNTFVRVASFRRPWVMEPFAWPGIGWLWLQGMRTPVLYLLMRMMGVHSDTTADEIRAYREQLLLRDGGRAFLKIMRGFERTPEYEQGIVLALTQRTYPAQVIWGREDPALRMADHAPPLCEVLGLNGWETVRGKHFLQESSPVEIADAVAQLAATGKV